MIGVGHAAELYAVKAFSRNGTAWTSDIIDGIQWCIDNRMAVINMSFGSSVASAAEEIAIKNAYAAGNTGGSVSYPAKYVETIAVYASDSGDLIASFSSRGPEVDLIAPGVGIVSTYLESGYAIGSGTSMAAPHVTGAVALVLSAQPGLGPEEVRALLKAKADDIGLSPDEQGAGLVDAEEPVSTVIPFVN